jgi:chitinase
VNGGVDHAAAVALETPAHAAGCKVLITIGGAGTVTTFRAAISSNVRSTFVHEIVQFVAANGYDGVDLDMEPLEASDMTDYAAFVRLLRSSLSAGLLLTAAVTTDSAPAFAAIQDQFDQINVMTYDMSGPWPGWVTWHNGPLSNSNGLTFPSTGALLPSIESTVAGATGQGVARAKLGIGIAFYGYVWSGATGPDQSIAGVTVSSKSYSSILDDFGSIATPLWDSGAQASYFGIGGADPKFVSFDDERDCTLKVQFVKSQLLGGVIIWELAQGWRPNQPVGRQDPLLQAVKAAAR